MEKSFWLERWDNKQIGFHLEDVNPILINHWNLFQKNQESKTILVPLCGKTKDIIFFAQENLHVFGAELSNIAIEEFFKENKLSYLIEESEHYKKYICNELPITLFQADIFNLTPNDLIQPDIIYDRACIVALPEDIRMKYINWINSMSTNKTRIFLNVLEFDAPCGPPFSISNKMVHNYFDQRFSIKEIETVTVPKDKMRIHEGSISWLKSSTYFLA